MTDIDLTARRKAALARYAILDTEAEAEAEFDAIVQAASPERDDHNANGHR